VCSRSSVGFHGSNKGVKAPSTGAPGGDIEAWSCESMERGEILGGIRQCAV